MKVRKGFVSNSSSSSFVIAITRDYVFSPEIKQKIYNEYIGYWDEEEVSMEQFDNILKEGLDELCTGDGVIWEEDSSSITQAILAELEDVVIAYVDVGPDAGSTNNIFADNQIEKVKKQLQAILEKDKK